MMFLLVGDYEYVYEVISRFHALCSGASGLKDVIRLA